MNNAAFGKIIENVRKYRVIKVVKTKARINYLVLEPTKNFTDNLFAIEMKRTCILMNKPV